jgi:hypothetical protein
MIEMIIQIISAFTDRRIVKGLLEKWYLMERRRAPRTLTMSWSHLAGCGTI